MISRNTAMDIALAGGAGAEAEKRQMTYAIEKTVPLPGRKEYISSPGARAPARRWARKYPFRAMEVGDSFLVEPREANRARSAASKWSKRHRGFRFTSRRMPDGDYRIWRIACKTP
jgi:hypothetical protein